MLEKVKNVANIRDLGGIVCADGKHVIGGRLIRGGHLNSLTPEEAKELAKEVSLVVDLRSPSELAEKPDVIPEGVDYVFLPSLTNEQNPSINRKNRTKELKRIMKMDGGAVGHLSRTYRTMITQEMSKRSHRELLMNLLDRDKGAVYWHCTQGKDRTGIAALVILGALGASKEAIMVDYLNEKKSLKIRNHLLTILVGVCLLRPKAKTNLFALMSAKIQCIEAAFDEIEKNYGNLDNYIRLGLGVSAEQIAKLRKMYLA